jgi:hypothetical protein
MSLEPFSDNVAREYTPPCVEINVGPSTIGHPVRSAHLDGLFGYWEVGKIYRCKRVTSINIHITN